MFTDCGKGIAKRDNTGRLSYVTDRGREKIPVEVICEGYLRERESCFRELWFMTAAATPYIVNHTLHKI